jgi:HSF-type DNA-binding
MLESIDPNNSPHGAIVRWLPHGRAFQIFHLEAFESIVLPLHFRFQSKFASFQRQLNLYGFKRLHVTTTAAGKSAAHSKSKAYYHELFLRSRPHLCRLIPRNPIAMVTATTGTTGSAATTTSTAGAACAVDRRALDPTSEPNFDRLPPLPETTTAVYGDAAVVAASLEDEEDASPDIPMLLPTTTARLKTTGLSISTHDQAAVASPLPFWPAPVVAAHGASLHEPHNALSILSQSTALEMALRQRLLEAAATTQPLSHDLVSLIRYQPPSAAAAPTTLAEYAALLNVPLQPPPPPSLQQRMQQQLWGSSQQLHAAVTTSAADLRLAGAAAAEASLHNNNHHNVLSATSLWPSHRRLAPSWRPSAQDDLASWRNHVSLLPTSSSNIHSLPPPPPTTSLGQHVLYAAGMMTRSAASAGTTATTTAVNPPLLAPWQLSSSPAARQPLESAFPSCTTPTTTTAMQQYIHSLQQQEDSDSPSTLDPVLEALLLQRLRHRDLRQDM